MPEWIRIALAILTVLATGINIGMTITRASERSRRAWEAWVEKQIGSGSRACGCYEAESDEESQG